MKLVALAVGTVFGFGCLADSEPPPRSEVIRVDPVGTWRVRITWNSGTCGIVGSADTDVTVVRDSTGYAIKEPQWVTVGGSVACSSEQCLMSFTMSGPGPGHSGISSAQLSADLAVDDAGAISGTGGITYTFTDGTSCSQQFGAGGVLL